MLDRILIVDDEPLILEVLTEVLTQEGYQVSQAQDGGRALEILGREPHVLVLCDIRLPGMDGFELLREVHRCHPGTDVIMMTGFGSLDGAIDAMTLGAADYLIKPLKPKEIVARIRSLLLRRRLEAELHSLQSELRSRYQMHNIVSSSARMTAVVSALNRIADSEEPLVIHGEAGTGRRFLARAAHYASPRHDQAFATLACDSTPAPEIAKALFGAMQANGRHKRGLLERHGRATLHVYHFELMPPDVQERLARCIETRKWSIEEGREERPLEARLVLTTNASISDHVDSGTLVPSLALLRDVVTIHLPPLRDRFEDLPGLVSAYIEEHAIEHGVNLRVEPEAIELFRNHPMPGNVKQLFSILGHCATLALDGHITTDIVARGLEQASFTMGSRSSKPIADQLGDREYQLVLRAVQRNPGRLDEAARELGVSRTTLWRRMRKYGIKVGSPS